MGKTTKKRQGSNRGNEKRKKTLLGLTLFAIFLAAVLGYAILQKKQTDSFSFSSKTVQKPVVEIAPKAITNNLGMRFTLIPSGTFIMGSPTDEPRRRSDETQHYVTISQAYYLQTTEVTQGQWKKVMGNNPSYFKMCGDECPVEQVSWQDTQEFIHKLNSMGGDDKYRLPSEAEWENAARAGTTTALYNGPIKILGDKNAPALDAIAWYGGNSCVNYAGGYDSSSWKERQESCSRSGTHPVSKKQPNVWGLNDMLGNVWEWVQDWYGEYPSGQVTDPHGPSTGLKRVVRGGSWGYDARYCRSAIRSVSTPIYRSGVLGFRLARTK